MKEKIVTIDGRQYELRVEAIEVLAVSGDEAEVRIGGRTHVIPFARHGSQVSFAFDGEIYSAEVTAKGAGARARQRDQSMSAPMPGTVLKILVKPGDVVAKGAPLVILEAMKMEHPILASHDGTVSAVNCREGEMVDAGVDLVALLKT